MNKFGGNFDDFPVEKSRKRMISTFKNRAILAKEGGIVGMKKKYSWLNSSLDGGSSSFFYSFEDILPKGTISLRDYIQSTLEEKRGKAVGVEFGGIGVKVFSEFPPGFFKKSIGMTLLDHRTESEKQLDLYKVNHGFPHQVLERNMLESSSYRELEKILAGDKVDFIVERLELGLSAIPQELVTVSSILERWYNLLNEGGVMMVQVPGMFNPLLKKWAEMIEKDYKDVLEFKCSPRVGYASSGDISPNDSVFRLRKLKGAPEKLPLLS